MTKDDHKTTRPEDQKTRRPEDQKTQKTQKLIPEEKNSGFIANDGTRIIF